MVSQVDAAFNYNDLHGLNNVKAMARDDDPEALKVVAQQFESMFIGMVLKSMREATDVMSSDMLSSNETRFYRDMYDQQLSLSLAQNGGYGLADSLYEQLSRQMPQRDQDFHNIEVDGLDESRRPVLPGTEPAQPVSTAAPPGPGPQAVPQDDAPADAGEDSAVRAADEPLTTLPDGGFDSPRDFVESLLPHAEQAARRLGVEPRVLLSQAALETGWGQHMIRDGQGNNSHNFFGIKADGRWNGATAETLTREFFDGQAVSVRDAFRAYEGPDQAFQDYADFIESNPRYRQALSRADDPEAYARSLQDAGYATDPRYAEKILRIADSEMMRLAAASHSADQQPGAG